MSHIWTPCVAMLSKAYRSELSVMKDMMAWSSWITGVSDNSSKLYDLVGRLTGRRMKIEIAPT